MKNGYSRNIDWSGLIRLWELATPSPVSPYVVDTMEVSTETGLSTNPLLRNGRRIEIDELKKIAEFEEIVRKGMDKNGK